MAAERVVAVVEVERVRGGAVDQRGVEGADASRVAEDQRGAARRTGDAEHDAGRGFLCAGEGDADGVEDADLGPVHGVGGQGIIF